MDLIKIILALGFALLGIWFSLKIIIDAFQDEIWKGILSLLCGLYWLYYAIFEYEEDNKWVHVLLALGGSGIAAGIMRL